MGQVHEMAASSQVRGLQLLYPIAARTAVEIRRMTVQIPHFLTSTL
jgi:hypothetical protein